MGFPQTSPYGSWKSPITADLVAGGEAVDVAEDPTVAGPVPGDHAVARLTRHRRPRPVAADV